MGACCELEVLFKTDIACDDCNVSVCISPQFSGLTPSVTTGSGASILPKGSLLHC